MNLAQTLDRLGLDPLMLEVPLRDLDQPIKSWGWLGTSIHGHLAHYVGGCEALIQFEWEDESRRPGYIVRDDNAGRVWDAVSTINQSLRAGPRPHPRLRWAQSA